jgi:endonuclease-3 related protein
MEVNLSGSTGKRLLEMFNLMLKDFGPQHWWPGETKLEIMVGAILTQNTNWNNVEKAIKNLKANKLLSIDALHFISASSLAENIRPAGYYNIKAARLKNLINFIMENFNGDIPLFLGRGTDELRRDLISINGIGPETADSILLYAANQPVFVVDTYTHRILNRHGLVDDHTTYFDLQELFTDRLPEDTELFKEFHALIVRTGKEHCHRKPRCDACPLERW